MQREPAAQGPSPAGNQPASSPSVNPAPAEAPKKCPHCDVTLAAKDVASGRCWFCEKKLTDPVEPKARRAAFLAVFLFGFLGAVLGMVAGLVFLGGKNGLGSWSVSLCGGVGLAAGSTIARSIFGRRK
jgi:hypothetical protein